MKTHPDKFIKSLSIFTALIAASCLAIQFLAPQLLTKYWWLLQMMLVAITLGIITIIPGSNEKKFSRFANLFMMTSMLKILLLLIVISAYAFTHPHDAVRFSIAIVAFYFLYLGFEVYWLLKLNKKGN